MKPSDELKAKRWTGMNINPSKNIEKSRNTADQINRYKRRARFIGRTIPHTSFFIDRTAKKHLRLVCPSREKFIIAETELGQVVALHFKRPQRSETNRSNFVRLSLPLRVTFNYELTQLKAKKTEKPRAKKNERYYS